MKISLENGIISSIIHIESYNFNDDAGWSIEPNEATFAGPIHIIHDRDIDQCWYYITLRDNQNTINFIEFTISDQNSYIICRGTAYTRCQIKKLTFSFLDNVSRYILFKIFKDINLSDEICLNDLTIIGCRNIEKFIEDSQ